MYLNEPITPRQMGARSLLTGAPLERADSARTCAAHPCATHLSRYNPSAVCARHSGWRDEPKTRRRSFND